MNENLQPLGNDQLEARITAWVLGEASPFEAAELEALCEKNPELRIFHHRTLTLHKLLKETHTSESDHSWKLPPAKREKLDSILGSNETTETSQKASRIRRASFRAAYGIAAILILTFVISKFLFIPGSVHKESPTIVSYSAAQSIDELKEAIREQEDKVEEQRKILTTISRTKNLVYYDNRDTASPGGSDEDSAAKYAINNFAQLEGEKKQLESQIESLLKYDDDQLVTYASGLDLPDNVTKSLYPQYLEQKRQIAGLKASGLAENHPAIESNQKVLDSMQDALDDGVTNLRTRLQGQLDMTKERLAKVEKKKIETKQDALERSIDTQDYVDAKSDFESNQKLLEQMKLKLIEAEIAANISEDRIDLAENSSSASQKKPSPPSASKAKAVAANTPAPTSNPVPELALAEPSQDFGDGSDFGGGWSDGSGGGKDESLAMNETRFRAGGAGEVLIDPSEGATIPAIPETEGNISGIITGGLRSGDAAISRNNIDAILNNPDRTASAGKPAALAASQPIEEAQQLRKTGKYDEARELLKLAEASAPDDSRIKEEIAYLDDPIRTNPALTDEHTRNIDEVRRKLYMAQGNYDLGKFDDAKKAYEDTLRIDPYNSAARRGMEKIQAAKSDYYRAAYGHTRSELLAEVDEAWELEVPAEERSADFSPPPQAKAPARADQDVRAELLAEVEKAWDRAIPADPSEDKGDVADNQNLYGQARAGMRIDSGFNNTDADLFAEEPETSLSGKSEYLFRGLALTEEQKPLDLANLTDRAHELRKQIEEPAINDSKKQALFKEWQEIQNELIARAAKSKPVALADLSEEIPAAQEPFSTFSLNISDASFQLALAAVEKGERPDPTSIKPEQFYNAVDYGDPAPSSLEPVAAAIDQTAHPVIPGRNLVRVAIRTASTGRSAAQPLRLTLLVDQSGSMARADRRAAMETALTQLATLLTENDRITVIGFSRTPRLLADSLPGNEAAKLPDLVNTTASEGGTNLEQALNLASELSLRHKLDGAQNRIVLFTDGAANLGDADPDRLAGRVKQLRQQGLAFDIAGIGTNDTNDRLLAELARHGNGRYYLVGENTGASLATQLAGAFRPAAENVKVQVRLNPERVGSYKLIGFEKDRLETEDFRDDSVDAAELAADEAGVAIYQVETLPEGSGEIGEVSVRFRDTASGEMVERTWTIPHDPTTPAFDKADPKTQLATLALLAAQKLQGGPLAEAIRFPDHAETIARLKQTYAKDEKAQRLFTLINALR